MTFRVLMVDDRLGSLGAEVAELSEVPGVSTTRVASGYEALRLLPREHFDLIIADLDVEDIDGFEFINFVKRSPRYRDTPVVMVSRGGPDDLARGRSLGAAEQIVKPLRRGALLERIRRYLSFAPASAPATA